MAQSRAFARKQATLKKWMSQASKETDFCTQRGDGPLEKRWLLSRCRKCLYSLTALYFAHLLDLAWPDSLQVKIARSAVLPT